MLEARIKISEMYNLYLLDIEGARTGAPPAAPFPNLAFFTVVCILIASSLSGLGMKPTSHPSLTNLPIHHSLLYFLNLKIRNQPNKS
jgi:hypothetical protein